VQKLHLCSPETVHHLHTRQLPARPALVARLSNPPFRSDSADVRGCVRRGLTALLDWLEQQPGQTWQERWLASGAEAEGRAWTGLVRRDVPSLASSRWAR
jgi:hypothetical protein